LFWRGEPISKKKLSEILNADISEIDENLAKIKENFKERGIVIVEKEDKVTLGTAPEVSELIEKLQKEELNKELSKASLETLSIVLYKNGISRSEIDYIRGVNSSFILRALSIRGLVERSVDPKDNRRFIYKPSFDLMSFMGIKSLEELPDYHEINHSIAESVESVAEELKDESSEEGQ
jgi:segregation and condensation protein B